MARLFPCPDCGNQVSLAANACPNCGRILRRPPKQYGCCGSLLISVALGLLGLFFVGLMSHRGPEPDPIVETAPGPSLLPAVASFLDIHREFGIPQTGEELTDWANGKRQRVRFDSGRILIFYETDGFVVTVYDDTSGERKIVWK